MTGGILITGATSGIGRACAEYLASKGHTVLAGGRNPKALQELRDLAKARGWRLFPLRLDVTDSNEIHAAADEALRLTEGKGIEVLVNNAGIGQAGFLTDLTTDQLRAQFNTSFFGLFEITRAFVPQLLARRGRVINIGSIMGRMTAPWMGAYGSVKAAVRSLTETLRVELGALGIRVALIEPGSVETSFHSRAIGGIDHGELPQSLFAGANRWLKDHGYSPFYLMRSVGPNRIAALVERIALSRRPRARYVTPFASRMLLLFMNATPSSILDPLKRRIFHLNPAQ